MQFFTIIYEWLLGKPLPSSDTLTYREEVFPNAGLCMLGIALVLVLFYYYGLNNKLIRTAFFNRGYWFLLVLLSAVIIGFVTSYLAQKQGVDPHSYITRLSLLNAAYGAITFVVLSFLLKRWSTAYTSPIRWPSKN